MDIKITKAPVLKEKPDSSTLGFGRIFTDHMFMMDYSREEGWHDARIVPFGNISLYPASTVLHYGSEIFEGLKAYRRKDGKVQLFRPTENIKRMNNSAERLCLPQIPEDDFMQILDTFIGYPLPRAPHFTFAPLCSVTMKIWAFMRFITLPLLLSFPLSAAITKRALTPLKL